MRAKALAAMVGAISIFIGLYLVACSTPLRLHCEAALPHAKGVNDCTAGVVVTKRIAP